MGKKAKRVLECGWCGTEERPVVGIPRVGRKFMICPVCRGPENQVFRKHRKDDNRKNAKPKRRGK